MDVTPLLKYSSRQHGLISVDQAFELGWSRSKWHRAQRGGTLVPERTGVARLVGAPSTLESRLLAATLSLGAGAVVSHRSAAYLWGLDIDPESPIDVTMVGRTQSRAVGNVALHRPCDLVDLRMIRRQDVPCTNPLRVLVDLGAVAPERVADAVAHFAIEGLVSPAAAWAAAERHSRQGRHGVVALRAALADWRLGSKPPDSVLEVRMARLLAESGLPPAEFHPIVGRYEVDFRIIGTRLLIECDGWAWHGARQAQVDRDYERDAVLGRAGWVVRRFSWLQILRRPSWVAAIIRDHLAWVSRG